MRGEGRGRLRRISAIVKLTLFWLSVVAMSGIHITSDGRSGVLITEAHEPELFEPFLGPRLKILRARSQLAELEQTILEFARTTSPLWQHWWEPHYEHMQAWWLTWTGVSHQTIPLIVADIAQNLRASFDLLIHDIARHRGLKPPEDLQFPFAEDEASWKEIMEKKSMLRLGKDVVAAISEIGAYRNGPSSGLRQLHDLNNLNKHRLLVPTYAATWAKSSMPPDLLGKLSPSRIQNGLVKITTSDVFLVRKGLGFAMLPTPCSAPEPFFPDGLPKAAPFHGHPVLKTLNDAADNVKAHVEALANQFGSV